MTLSFKRDLDILPLDLHTKNQVCMSFCSAVRVVTDGRTDRHTDNVKTITPVVLVVCVSASCRFMSPPVYDVCRHVCECGMWCARRMERGRNDRKDPCLMSPLCWYSPHAPKQ